MGSILTSVANAVATFGISFPTVVDSIRGRRDMRVFDRRLGDWGPRVLDRAGVRLTIEGREHIVPAQPYVLMSNHASFYDIPVLYTAWGGNLRMVAKTELFQIPVFGRAMHTAGFIEVDRKNRSQAVHALEVAKHLLEDGTSLWISPEGTRSGTDKLGPFKKGGFRLALDAGLPILPVSLRGTWNILPPHTAATQRGQAVHVTFHPPLDTKRYVGEEQGPAHEREALERLMNDVREAIAKGL